MRSRPATRRSASGLVLARPDHLHGPFHVLRDPHRPDRPVVLEAAAERSAEEVVMDAGLLAREAGELHRLVSDLNG